MKLLLTLIAACFFAIAALADWNVQPSALIEQARKQVGVTLSYDPAYRALSYPGGDVPKETGVCSDVVVRALRGLGIDLQKEVHEDMRANFAVYPKRWGLAKPDTNIDHRRVLNLQTFFKRRGYELPLTKPPKGFQPGDIVTCLVAGNLPHIFILSDRKSPDGTLLAIHNIGSGAQEEEVLTRFPLTGHYRLPWKP